MEVCLGVGGLQSHLWLEGRSLEGSSFPTGPGNSRLEFWGPLSSPGNPLLPGPRTQASWRVRAGLQQAPCQTLQPAHQESCC